MIDLVLQKLDTLRAELELIDPTRDLAASGKVADIAASLHRLTAKHTTKRVGAPANGLPQRRNVA